MRKVISATLLLAVSGLTQAAVDPNSSSVMSNFSYDYVEARIGASPNTYGAGMSMSIHPNAHVIGRVDSKLEGDMDASGGVGFHAPINNWADFTGEALLKYIDPEHGSSDTGMELNLGVRQWLGPQLEVGGKVGYLTIDDNDDWLGAAFVRFHSTELFSVGAEARFNDVYDDQLMFSARFKF
ncbi:hypothetical protein OAP63_02825 [Vibrio sp.]|nr:hypothetical protein [Vibrio sp.]